MNSQKLMIAGTVSLVISNSVVAQPPIPQGPIPQGPIPYTSPNGPPMIGLEEDPSGVAPLPHTMPPGPLPPRALRRRDLSWIYIDRPRPKKLAVHDIITVVVDEKSESTQNTRFNRQRNIIFNAVMREFIRISSTGNLATAAPDAPGIQGQLQSQMQSYGQGLSQEGLKYRIAATVVDILPNGTLILEARKSILTNDALWEYSLTGKIRTQDVEGNNTVHSENVADLKITKRENGKIPDSTKRGILTKLYDRFLPF